MRHTEFQYGTRLHTSIVFIDTANLDIIWHQHHHPRLFPLQWNLEQLKADKAPMEDWADLQELL